MRTFGVRFFFGALLTGVLVSMPPASLAQLSIAISTNNGPPALPIYVQPPALNPTTCGHPAIGRGMALATTIGSRVPGGPRSAT